MTVASTFQDDCKRVKRRKKTTNCDENLFVLTTSEANPLLTKVTDNLNGRPRSLFAQCVDFVSRNLDLVESFEGFPEQVAEVIFKTAASFRQFEDPETGPRRLRVFCETYPEVLVTFQSHSVHLLDEYDTKVSIKICARI